MRTITPTGSVCRSYFHVYDIYRNPITGLEGSAFPKLLSKDGATNSTTVVITEVGTGVYTGIFTPSASGIWNLRLSHATYNPRGWEETFDVGGLDRLDVAVSTRLSSGGFVSLSSTERDAICTALLDLASAVDGATVRETLRGIAAVLMGESSGFASGAGTRVFRDIADTKTRITATQDADGNRTAVTKDLT